MRERTQTSPEKLRGGFYTPDGLVDLCWERVTDLLAGPPRSVLEPSAGDGAFLRGVERLPAGAGPGRILAIEPLAAEARKARAALARAHVAGDVVTASAIAWAADGEERFDAAVGNPPFVRYQFIVAEDRRALQRLGARLGVPFRRVGNLWIGVLLGALSRLRAGGAFAFVVPTECLTGCSATLVRGWLLAGCARLRFDLFAAGSFPGVLQEVAVLSGVRRAGADPTVEVVEHDGGAVRARWRHRVAGAGPWTRYLLAPDQAQGVDAALGAAGVVALGDVARFEVSIVTGANAFFSVDAATVAAYELRGWARPLLARARHAPGLVHRAHDHAAAAAGGARAWLLDFAADAPDPRAHPGPAAYLRSGEERGLPGRFKCRIREPWYRVPGIRAGDLLLPKRSHRHARMVLNRVSCLTTDTIYRGWAHHDGGLRAPDVAAVFHSSLTLLCAELEGRSLGGGVLELVPSEIARLRVAALPGAGRRLACLDRAARRGDPELLVAATDRLLVDCGTLDEELLAAVRVAHAALRDRRLRRNRGAAGSPGWERSAVT